MVHLPKGSESYDRDTSILRSLALEREHFSVHYICTKTFKAFHHVNIILAFKIQVRELWQHVYVWWEWDLLQEEMELDNIWTLKITIQC